MDDRQKRELKDNPMLALELLTAGGSEFHNDPVRCYQDIRHKLEFRHQKIVEAMRQRDAAKAEVARLREWIIEASSAYRLDGGTDTLDEAVSLVRMCHEGRAAIDEAARLRKMLYDILEWDDPVTLQDRTGIEYDRCVEIINEVNVPRPRGATATG